MKEFQVVFLILGASFAGIGTMIAVIFLFAFGVNDGLAFIMIPLFFVIIGLCFIGAVINSKLKEKRIISKGKKYSGKIYGYVDNTSYTVNGQFTVDTKVHYFDENGTEREAVIPTGFSKGSNGYPIGMTIDIYEYNGKYNYDSKSVRNEILARENELMDDKPVDPLLINIIAVKCPNCGASFEAAYGYSNKCPYCDGYINA